MGTRPTPTLDEHLDLIFEAARTHGEDDDAEHEVGDLQTVISLMWDQLSDDQKMAVITSDQVMALLEDWGS